MLSEPISFTGKLTLQDALDLHRYHSRCVVRPSIRLLLALFSLACAAFIVFLSIRSRFSPGSIFFLVLCAYNPFGWLLLNRFSVAWHYRRHPEQFIEHTATFTNESVQISSIHSDTRLNWHLLSAIVSTPRGLLFLLPPHTPWFWLPQREFYGNNYKDAILELAVEKQIPIRRST